MKALAGLSIVGLLLADVFNLSCQRESSRATELFHLRSECATMGQKIHHDPVVGYEEMLSRYDPLTNRCYVELTYTTSTEDRKALGGIDRYLYDGQTRELLAQSNMGFSGREVGGFRWGEVENDASLPTDADARYKAADDFIEKAMADDRKQ
jgi:hypothetical protein